MATISKSSLLLSCLILITNTVSAQSYRGIAPDEKYGLPNNVARYLAESGTIETCIRLPDKEQRFGVSFKVQVESPPAIVIEDTGDFNPSALSTPNGAVPQCSGTYDPIKQLYHDIILFDSIPHYIVFELVEGTGNKFQLLETSVIPETADVAFVLRGYNGNTNFAFPASFHADAKIAMKGLADLSFGEAGSYRIFDGGIDPNGPDFYQSLEDLKVVDAALSGWTGSPWSFFKDRDESSGTILVNPTSEEIFVLNELRQWLVANKKGARAGWRETELGVLHFDAWVNNKVLRYGGTAASSFLKEYPLPSQLITSNFKTIGIIFSSADQFNTSGAQSRCSSLGITGPSGQELDYSEVCFYVDYSNPDPEAINAQLLAASNARTTIHEAIHGFGHSGHDRDEIEGYFPYSVMNQGEASQYPVWNRIYLTGWLTESTITTDPQELKDSFQAKDPSAKYLLRLGPESDFDCQTEFGVIVKCHRYQELYKGNWIQYKATYTVNGVSFFKGGVTFEPLNDPSDKIAPALVASSTGFAQVVVSESEHSIIFEFDEGVNLGTGTITLNDENGQQLASYHSARLPELSSNEIKIAGNLLTLITYRQDKNQGILLDQNGSYSVVFSSGAIIDRAGNSVLPSTYAVGK